MRKDNKRRMEMSERVSFGNRLKSLRIRCNLTQAELAAKIGVEAAQISVWEKGKTEPGIYGLCLLAEVFGLSIDKVVGFENLTREDEFNLWMRF